MIFSARERHRRQYVKNAVKSILNLQPRMQQRREVTICVRRTGSSVRRGPKNYIGESLKVFAKKIEPFWKEMMKKRYFV